MNGTNRVTVVSTKLLLPTGLAIDYPAARLYWCDGKKKTIESSRLDGSDRRVVRRNLDYPYSIDIQGNEIYMTSRRSGKLYKLNKFGRGNPEVLFKGLGRPVSVKVYQKQRQRRPTGWFAFFL